MAVEKAGFLLSREHEHVEEDEEEEEETKKLSKDRREGDQELSRMWGLGLAGNCICPGPPPNSAGAREEFNHIHTLRT